MSTFSLVLRPDGEDPVTQTIDPSANSYTFSNLTYNKFYAADIFSIDVDRVSFLYNCVPYGRTQCQATKYTKSYRAKNRKFYFIELDSTSRRKQLYCQGIFNSWIKSFGWLQVQCTRIQNIVYYACVGFWEMWHFLYSL